MIFPCTNQAEEPNQCQPETAKKKLTDDETVDPKNVEENDDKDEEHEKEKETEFEDDDKKKGTHKERSKFYCISIGTCASDVHLDQQSDCFRAHVELGSLQAFSTASQDRAPLLPQPTKWQNC